MNIKDYPLEQKKAIILNTLSTTVALVEFTKVNGENRVMPCTLDPARLPATPFTEGKVERKVNPDVQRVFCTDKNEWRSFRFDSVISITEAGK
jgi:hypothetical protein